METLPREIINKIFSFTQHPVSELFKKEFKILIEDMDDDENFSYQWADMKEQRKYNSYMKEQREYLKEATEYCNFCEELQIGLRDPYHCPSCGQIFSCYN